MREYLSERAQIRLTPSQKLAIKQIQAAHGCSTQRLIVNALIIAFDLDNHARLIREHIEAQETLPGISLPDTWSGREDPAEEYERELMRHELA